MNGLVFHIVSGDAFFSGGCLVVAGLAGPLSSTPVVRRGSLLAVVIGLVLVAASSTPLPYWCYGLLASTMLLWLVALRVPRWQKKAVGAAAVAWLAAMAVEVPYHVAPKLKPVSARAMTVVGDSVTAGIGSDQDFPTWPEILRREENVHIQDLSRMGETTASALKRLREHPVEHPLVVVEIGGNDLLGSTGTAKFARDLDALLQAVCAADRQVIMFELPLPPLHHEWGRIQRDAARKYDVKLLPRREFLSVLAGGGATLDSIHLSEAGQQAMSRRGWEVVGPVMVERSVTGGRTSEFR
ncbi:Esterase TesA precursor [Maioricimonas rarisocia]|uniref:Esterase TesA n=2 Tax=Maioricimonas rarisocia TaxID=2528026 RepID=A0A517ZE51_9PLAN|nr:Esterase TesA precursor [Maioricimonas rarisocia]